MSGAIGALHAASAVVLAAVATVQTLAPSVRARALRIGSALCATVVLVTGIARIGPWEHHGRRAVYLVARALAPWLERENDLGAAACLLALAAAIHAMAPDADPRARRLLDGCTAAFALAALGIAAVLRLRLPPLPQFP